MSDDADERAREAHDRWRRVRDAAFPVEALDDMVRAAMAAGVREGEAKERARVVAWHDARAERASAEADRVGYEDEGEHADWCTTAVVHRNSATAIERGEHAQPVASAPAAGAEMCHAPEACVCSKCVTGRRPA